MRQTDPLKPITEFDKDAVYKSKIEPAVTELVKLCTIYGIPMYITCCVSNDATGTEYRNNCVSAETRGLNLTDDNIQKHLCIQLGFDTIYRSEAEFDFEDEEVKSTKKGN